MNGSMVGGSAIISNFKTSKFGVDVLEVDVLGVDFKALIPWENGSEQDKERMSSVIHPLQHLYSVDHV